MSSRGSQSVRRAAIALGSNLGDRPSALRDALLRLASVDGIVAVDKTSRLYESKPMYVTDQPAFLNAAAEIRTTLGPLELLRSLKDTEREMGRQFGAEQLRWGPRPIDLDIIFYEDETVMKLESDGHARELIVPHPRWQERSFVIGPLADLASSSPSSSPSSSMASSVASGLDKHLLAAKRLWMEQGGERWVSSSPFALRLPPSTFDLGSHSRILSLVRSPGGFGDCRRTRRSSACCPWGAGPRGRGAGRRALWAS